MSILYSEAYKSPNLGLAVSLGLIPGVRSFRKFGMNSSADTGTEEVWPLGTIRTLPAAAGTVSIVSDSANDTAAGTGCQTLMVEGLDADYVEIAEQVTMSGLTPVVTTKEFLRVNRSYVMDTGSLRINDGGITLSLGGGAHAYVQADEGQTHMSQYTVPAEHTLIITGYYTETGRVAGSANCSLLGQIRPYHPTRDLGWRTISDTEPYQHLWVNENSFTAVPEKTELRALSVSTANAVHCVVVYSGYLLHNDHVNTLEEDF